MSSKARQCSRSHQLVAAALGGALAMSVFCFSLPLTNTANAQAGDKKVVGGGQNPAAQRNEMISLLKSIDSRLEQLVKQEK